MNAKSKRPTVAEYITAQIALSGKKQNEIHSEVGFNTPNVISMIKTNKLKLPVAKIVPMAKALGVDPLYMLRFVMTEYHPEIWETIEEALGNTVVLSESEHEFINLIRESGVTNPTFSSDEERAEFVKFVSKMKAG